MRRKGDKMKFISLIYTFDDNTPQEFIEYDVTDEQLDVILKDKQSLFEEATRDLSDEAKQKLVKISFCIYLNDEEYTFPEWFENWDGKLWCKNGELE